MEFPLFIVIADKMNCLFRESTNDWEAIFLHNDIWLECSSKVCLYIQMKQNSDVSGFSRVFKGTNRSSLIIIRLSTQRLNSLRNEKGKKKLFKAVSTFNTADRSLLRPFITDTSYMQQSFFLREVLNGISVRKDRQQNCKVSTKKLNN